MDCFQMSVNATPFWFPSTWKGSVDRCQPYFLDKKWYGIPTINVKQKDKAKINTNVSYIALTYIV